MHISPFLAVFWVLGVALKGSLLLWRYRLKRRVATHRGEERVKALECASCGYHIEGADEEELFDQLQIHVDCDHPELRLTDEQIGELVASGAREPGWPQPL